MYNNNNMQIIPQPTQQVQQQQVYPQAYTAHTGYAQVAQISQFPQQQVAQPTQTTQTKTKSGYNYPKQCFVAKRKENCFYIDDNLQAPKTTEYQANGGSYQPFYLHSHWSKFKFNILKYETKTSCVANIDPDEIENIVVKTNVANYLHITHKEETSENKVGAAYTVIITGGLDAIKGKTPAQSLLENPVGNWPALQKQYEFLAKNVQKYPKNQEQMDAIVEAMNLYNDGKLTADNISVSTNKMNLYEMVKIPDADYPDKNGNVSYVKVSVDCLLGSAYPIVVSIQNAKVKLLPGAGMNIDTNSFVDNKRMEFKLSMAEWNRAVKIMKESLADFESDQRRLMRTVAVQADLQNRSNN